MTPLCLLARKYGTDKCDKHHYTPVYYSLLKDRIISVQRVLEIGIKSGASLYMWEQFFPKAQIFGIDRKHRLLINAGRIRSFLGNQDNVSSLRSVAAAADGPFDLIVDDGSHQPAHQITSMRALLPYLADDGVYVIEDVNDDVIQSRVPAGYDAQKIRTSSAHSDSVLLILRRNMSQNYKKIIVQVESELTGLIDILQKENVRSYLEIGSKWGGSLWRVAHALPLGSRIVSVDMPNWMGGSKGSDISLAACVEELTAEGYDAHLVLGDSQVLATRTQVAALAPFDAAFIDADHSLKGVTQDWKDYGPLARIVAFHDIAYRRNKPHIEVAKFWDNIKTKYRHQEIKQREDNCGIGVLWQAAV